MNAMIPGTMVDRIHTVHGLTNDGDNSEKKTTTATTKTETEKELRSFPAGDIAITGRR